jgi:hypothetical protein
LDPGPENGGTRRITGSGRKAKVISGNRRRPDVIFWPSCFALLRPFGPRWYFPAMSNRPGRVALRSPCATASVQLSLALPLAKTRSPLNATLIRRSNKEPKSKKQRGPGI